MRERRLERILLVEDDPDIQLVASLALTRLGDFTVEVCSSGREALAAAPGFGPDLILLDAMMPVMDGPAALKALRTIPEGSATPVIFLTGRVQPQEIANYLKLGSLGVISKPFDPATLADRVREIWTRGR